MSSESEVKPDVHLGDSGIVSELHDRLFPISKRQITALGGQPTKSSRRSLQLIHGQIAAGLASIARTLGARGEVLDWIMLSEYPIASEFLSQLSALDKTNGSVFAKFAADPKYVHLGDAYEAYISGDLRHRLGEHYTPEALVRIIIDNVATSERVEDPACGDGRFLTLLLHRGLPPEQLSGCEINPLAVTMARLNVWIELKQPKSIPETRIDWADFLLAAPLTQAQPPPAPPRDPVDWFVGNPPWVLWRNLGDEYRADLGKQFAQTPLNKARGWGAKVSAGQTDLAHLFIHEALQRVAPNGRVGFVLPRSTFKGPVGASIVRTGMTATNRRYGYTRIVEVPRNEAFPEVRSDTIIAFAQTDTPQEFPVPWEIWRESGRITSFAQPSTASDPASSWTSSAPMRLAPSRSQTTIRARSGINTGGGNGVFHVRVLEVSGTMAKIVNVPTNRSKTQRTVEAWVEASALLPLIRGRDIERWSSQPSISILMPHRESDLRRPIAEEELRQVLPGLYSYLLLFKDELSERKEVARWSSDWYSLFRIGSYTSGCHRVIWPTSSAGKLRADVLDAADLSVMDQKVVVAAAPSRDAALFLGAVLNSNHVQERIRDSFGMDASASLLQRVAIPEFDPSSPVDQRLVNWAKSAKAGEQIDIQVVNDLVQKLYD